jgi:hypothetical protein
LSILKLDYYGITSFILFLLLPLTFFVMFDRSTYLKN